MGTSILVAILLSGIPRITSGTPLEYPSEIKEAQLSGSHVQKGSTKHTADLAIGNHVLWYVCAASIVRQDFVITAGHCIEPLLDLVTKEILPTSQAIVGTDVWNAGGIRLSLKEYYLHPEWDYELIKNDIGLFKVEKIPLGENIGIIPQNFNAVHGGEASYVTGYERYGVVRRRKVLDVLPLNPQQCADAIFAAGPWAPPVHADVEICTRTLNWDGTGRCNGDAGSAVVLHDKYEQIGVISWGFDCHFHAPAVNVRISAFEGFLNSVMKRSN